MAGAKDIERFSESGRGVPVTLSRPGSALPMSPVARSQYAQHPSAHLGWAQGQIFVADVPLEPYTCSLDRDATVGDVARRLATDDTGFVPICHGRRIVGVVYEEDVLKSVADGQIPPNVGRMISSQFPTCAPKSALVDAVRLMLACYLRKLPVVGDAGELLGLLTLSEAAAAAGRDPTVADVLERFALSPSLFARRLR